MQDWSCKLGDREGWVVEEWDITAIAIHGAHAISAIEINTAVLMVFAFLEFCTIFFWCWSFFVVLCCSRFGIYAIQVGNKDIVV
jgi:hypothetical protein